MPCLEQLNQYLRDQPQNILAGYDNQSRSRSNNRGPTVLGQEAGLLCEACLDLFQDLSANKISPQLISDTMSGL